MNRGKRSDIQALRAIAVLSVVVYHLWPSRLSGGFMGVDVFFVISGYLMTATIIRDAQPVIDAKNKLKTSLRFLANFYARRIKRLIPAASVTLISTAGLAFLTRNLALIQETGKQIVASTIFTQNWYLANNSVDYLANTNPTAVQHFWSLSLEEQFYLVWPLLLLLTLLLTSNLYVVYKKKRLFNLAVFPVFLMIVAFFTYGYYLTMSQPSLAYFVTPARVWELLIGGSLAFLPSLKNHILRLSLPWAGLLMILYPIVRWGGDNFPGWHALLPTVGAALIIYAGSMANKSTWSFENIFKYKPIQWIGDLSYSLYLWHWPLIILLPAILLIDIDKHPQSIIIKFGILILSVVIAQLSYLCVEKTTQRIVLKKRYIYSSFVFILMIVAGLGYQMSNRAEVSVMESVEKVHAIVLNDSELCTGAKSILNKCRDSFGHIDNNYAQIASNDKYDRLINSGITCSSYDARKYRPEIGDFCIVGSIKSKHQITVWGDSHAQHWINPMDKIGRDNNIKINIIGTSYCFGSTKFQKNCDIRFNKIKNSGALDKSSAIIISMWHSAGATNRGNNIVNALDTLQSLTKNSSIYLIEDVPISGPEGGPDCNALHLACRNSIENAVNPIKKDSEDLIGMGLITASRIISVKDMFCDDTFCYSNIGGIQVYRDKNIGQKKDSFNSHMTASYAYSVWPLLENKLIEIGIIK